MSTIVEVEGKNMVYEALASGRDVVRVVMGEEIKQDVKVMEIIELASKRRVKIEYVGVKQFKKMSGGERAQNVLASVRLEEVALGEILEAKSDPVFLVLNRIDYEQNLGAVLRTAWAGGVDAVLVSEHGVHEVTPVVSKVSMGGALYVPLIAGSLFPMLKLLRDYGVPIVGVEAEMGVAYGEQNLRGGLALVLGGEDAGVSEALRKYCDVFVHIPMRSAVNSLNVSVATGVVLFEKLRQDRMAG